MLQSDTLSIQEYCPRPTEKIVAYSTELAHTCLHMRRSLALSRTKQVSIAKDLLQEFDLPLHTASGGSNLLHFGINVSERDGLSIGEDVQGRSRDVKALSSGVDGKNVHALALVAELPAGTALGRVEFDAGHGTDVLGGQRPEGRVALRDQAVLPIGASYSCERRSCLVVVRIVSDNHGFCGGRGSERRSGESDECDEDRASEHCGVNL